MMQTNEFTVANGAPWAEPFGSRGSVVALLCCSGAQRLQAAGGTVVLQPGMLLLCRGIARPLPGDTPAMCWRMEWPLATIKEYLAAGHGDAVFALQGQAMARASLSAQSCNRLETVLCAALAEQAAPQPGTGALRSALGLQAAVLLTRALAVAERADTEDDLAAQVRRCIDAEYRTPLTLETLSSRFYLSKYHLSHEFRRRTGESIHQYLIGRRLAAARDALAGGATPGEAFAASGFGDYTNFFRAFSAAYRQSPRACAARFIEQAAQSPVADVPQAGEDAEQKGEA